MSGPFGAAHYAADGLAVLDHIGIARAHLAAGSIGGAVAIEMLAAAPSRILSVAAFGATMRIGLGVDDLEAMAKSLREMGVRRWFDEHGHRILGPNAQLNAAAELTRIAVGHGREVSLVTDVIWETFGEANSRPTVGRLADRRPPAIVAVGTHDPTCPLVMAEELAAALHAPAPLILDGIGHLPMLEDPQQVSHLISGLCRQSESSAR